jgi:predicted DNA binding CopG/RHH family protein
MIKKFKSIKDEREFWENNDSTEFINWNKSKKISFPNLKKTTKSISIRLPFDMIEKIKIRANKIDVPYQSLIKVMLQKELDA